MTLKRSQPEAYRILTKRKRAPCDALSFKVGLRSTFRCFVRRWQFREVADDCCVQLLRRKTVSLSLDDPELDESELSAVAKLLPVRRAFSVDVQAGLEPLLSALT